MFAQSFPNIAQSLRVPAVRPYISKFFTEVVENTVAYREKNKYSRKDFLQLLIDIKNNKELQENGNKGNNFNRVAKKVKVKIAVILLTFLVLYILLT
ncbi:hypothetical protein NQ314_020514 [Rhamnusium bicolor]|uniref:Uncharacterized protein n=1 Tax=Rhamnusium bicolor TaxID=1586634 RepID=A0AAV8WKP7_9CUCU|nr:hypothetical protein NQ314_020514 [Rhamnusium bicolor]